MFGLLLDAAATAAAGDDEIFYAIAILFLTVYGILLVCAPIAIWRWTRRTAERQEEANATLERIEEQLERIAEALACDEDYEDEDCDGDCDDDGDCDGGEDTEEETAPSPAVTHLTDPDALAR